MRSDPPDLLAVSSLFFSGVFFFLPFTIKVKKLIRSPAHRAVLRYLLQRVGPCKRPPPFRALRCAVAPTRTSPFSDVPGFDDPRILLPDGLPAHDSTSVPLRSVLRHGSLRDLYFFLERLPPMLDVATDLQGEPCFPNTNSNRFNPRSERVCLVL